MGQEGARAEQQLPGSLSGACTAGGEQREMGAPCLCAYTYMAVCVRGCLDIHMCEA